MRAIIAVATASLVFAHATMAQTLTDPSLIISPFITGLDQPTGIRFFAPNQAFVIQKGGAVQLFNNGALSNVLTLGVNTESERGLLGIALDPNFAANQTVYLYHSVGGPGSWTENRLSSYTWNGTALVNPTTLRVFGTSGDGQANGPNHNGGPLVFGQDGLLYGATGDLNRDRLEQNNQGTALSASVGGIYRLNTNGTTPADNPFTGSFAPWYTYGVRNSFGLAVDPVTGRRWDTENGPDAYDEINLLSSGMNSGWNKIMGPDSRDPQNAPGDLNMLPGATYVDPKFSFSNPIGITSLQFLYGSSWGASFNDAVLVGENNGGRLWLFRLNANRDAFVLAGSLADGVLDPGDTFSPFGNSFSVTTDIQIGPDGAVYIAALGSGTIYRIAPVPEPAVWATMVVGLGLLGWTVRRRRDRHVTSLGTQA